MEFKVGDYVSRESYNNDIVFIITDIVDNIAILKGFNVRLVANAPLSDLNICDEENRKDEFMEKLVNENLLDRSDNEDFFYLPPKLLQLDGDPWLFGKMFKFLSE